MGILVKNTMIPKMRFKRFHDNWTKVKLADTSDFYSGGTPKSTNEAYYNGDIPFIRSAEIDQTSTELFVNEEAINNSSAKYVNIGDILYAMYGANSGDVAISKINGVINQAVLAIIPNKEYDSYFLKLWLEMNKDRITTKYLQGGQGNLSATIIKKLTLTAPSYDEQQKIGYLFLALENLISVQEKQITNFVKYKKAMSQKLFPRKGKVVPELRFNGFGEEWQEMKLGDLLKYEQPTKYLVESEDYDDSYKTPVLTAGKSFILGYTNETEGIYDKGEVILFDDFTTDSRFIDFPFKVKSSATKFLTPIGDNDIHFLYEALQLVQYPTNDHKRYWISEYTTLKITVPSIEEQHLISHFLKTLDKQIDTLKQRVEEYKTLKKGLLQVMFI